MSVDDDASEGKKGLSKEAIDRMKKEFIYGVGYGQPPKEHQFKKGKSGNPKGRPRGMAPDLSLADEPVLQAVRNAFNKTVRVRDGDTFTEVAVLDAAVQATVAAIYKGNVRAAGLLFDLKRTGDQAHAREIKERKERWTKYKDFQSQRLAEAAKEGKPAPKILPHPDDVIIDDDEGVRFVGPVDEAQLKEMYERLVFRDLLLMQEALDERSWPRSPDTESPPFGYAFRLAVHMNNSLPARYRLSNIAMAWKVDRYLATSKRTLLKDLYRGWRKIGRPQRRGFVFPQEGPLAKHLSFVVDFGDRVRAGRLNIEDVITGKPSNEFLDFLEEHGQPIEPYIQGGTQ